MASSDVCFPGGISSKGLKIIASDRGYWRWRFMVLDKHSPMLA
ncbi:hypothetical protein AQ1_00398 [alpha proteobacterium Q-1]|jgi:hypothetical protein|nr:hypothetical protein AQ1_00398 [alpha proteobacterium Q-1]